jgi:deoxyribonuclease-4
MKGGLVAALSGASQMGCDCLQIFSRNPRIWKDQPIGRKEAAAAVRERRRLKLRPFVLHSIYLSNISSEDSLIHRKSTDSLAADMARAQLLEADYLVVHIRMGENLELRAARAVSAIDESFAQVPGNKAMLLLENTAKADPDKIFWNFIRSIFKASRFPQHLGLCLDTCHAYASGFDLSKKSGLNKLLALIERSVGLRKLGLIHANDCRTALGSGWDRHTHIGEGNIGLRGFGNIVNHPSLSHLPVIIETPKKTPEDDPRNLKVLRGLVASGK